MSLMAAIDAAVRFQLVIDRPAHYSDYTRVMGADIAGPPAVTGFGFNEAQLQVFLQKVARRLKFDTPSLNYDWTKTAVAPCLTANREALIEIISAATTEER